MKFANFAFMSVALTVGLSACGGGNQNSVTIQSVVTPTVVLQPSVKTPQFVRSTDANGLFHSSGFDQNYTAMPSLFAGGAAVGDIDGDQDLDLFIVRGDQGPNLLMINNGMGGFIRNNSNSALDFLVSPGVNQKTSGPVFADFDNDGDLDLFIGGLDGDPSRLFMGDGNGGFTDATMSSGIGNLTSENTISASVGDYDNDGDLDIALAHWGTQRLAANLGETETLLRNDLDVLTGTLSFTPVSEASGVSAGLGLTVDGKIGRDRDYSFAPNFSDIDLDGDLDLLIVADFNSSRVFQNNGDGRFTNITDPTQINDTNGMGTDIGDFNNDGRPDWFVSSINGNRLYRNASGALIDTPSANVQSGSWGWGSCFADFNLDGHLDIYQTNGWINNTGASPNEPYTADKSRLWINNGSAEFEDMAAVSGLEETVQGRSVICADFDDDLDTDILLLVNNGAEGAIYWDNQTSNSRAIGIKLDGPTMNKTGIGATITIESPLGSQTRWVRGGTTFTAQTSPYHVIGLASEPEARRIIVNWPDGTQSITGATSSGSRLTISHTP